MTPRAAPSVCVALSVKDGGEYLPEAIESVLAQEDVALELRIYDNGSTDGSLAVYERFLADPRVTLAANPEGAHFYTSMNRALAETEAAWFVPWCADDVMLPRNIVTKLQTATRVDAQLVCAPIVSIDAEGRCGKTLCNEIGASARVFDAPELFREITPWNRIALPGLLAGTSALRAVGGFDARLYLVGDWMMWLRLSLRIRCAYIPQPGVLYREHSANTTNGARRAGTFATELVAALRSIYRDPALPPELHPMFLDQIVEVLSGQAYSHIEHGLMRASQGPRPAYALAFEALLLDPTREPLVRQYQSMVRAAGLPPTMLPASVVAAPCPTAADVEAAMRALRRLLAAQGVVARAQIAARPEEADAIIELVEADLDGHGDIDLELSLVADPFALLGAGDIFIAQLDDSRTREAEERCGAVVFCSDPPADPLADGVEVARAA